MRRIQFKAGPGSILALCIAILVVSSQIILADQGDAKKPEAGANAWWEVTPEEEIPSEHYDSILYSEIAPKLREIQLSSNRVDVKVMGRSAGGRNLFLVTVSKPGSSGRFGHYKTLRKMMIRDPERALELLDRFQDFKVPVFINGSIHGDEYPGTDACIRLIETLAYENSEEVQAILDNMILLINVVQNPDGRVLGTRANQNGFDLNRDFITQSQPETRATVEVIGDWNPMVFLDLHGFVDPMLIEPCTPPHNPNYEYDLYLKWAFQQALAMETELFDRTGFSSQIPYRDFPDGWDDWPPIYAAMYPIYHGAYGHTLETPYEDERGVDAHYAVVWGALKFAVENKHGMLRDQIEVYRRGVLSLPQVPIPDELLAETPYDQYNELTVQEFPAAYVIPKDEPLQLSPQQPARLAAFLLDNDVQVESALEPFALNDEFYPRGTYVVWMDQPKRGLANTILEDGRDLSDIMGITFYSPPSVWSLPLLWGAHRGIMEERISIRTRPVKNVKPVRGSVTGRRAKAVGYAFESDCLEAYQAVNDLLNRGKSVYRSDVAFEAGSRSFGPGTFIVASKHHLARELARTFGLDIFAIRTVPEEVVKLRRQRIAAYDGTALAYCLETLGFAFETVSESEINGGMDLSGFDLFVNGGIYWESPIPGAWWIDALNEDGQAAVQAYLDSGGDYIGIYEAGADVAVKTGNLPAGLHYLDGNAIFEIDYNPDSPVASGFREDGYAFVYDSVWFSEVPGGTEIAASIDGGDFLVSGYLPGWRDLGAAGQPIILFQDKGVQDTTLIGIDPIFRGHPENAFRIIGNAIFSGIDN